MKLPAIVTNAALQALASPTETHEVHVIVRRIANAAPYTLRGRKRQYIVSRDSRRGAHILVVPLSVWMAGCSPDRVAENDSIAFDIQSSRTGLKAPLTFEMWPINRNADNQAAVTTPQAINIAPPGSPPPPPQPKPEGEPAPLTNAQRQAAHRARKKAEKEAQLQTANA